MGSRETGRERERDVVSSIRKWRGLFITTLIVGAVAIGILSQFVKANTKEITCKAPEGYVLVRNTMATNMAESKQFFIIEAIVSYGDGTLAGQTVTVPACFTNDDSLQNVGGIFARIDGKTAYIASGVIGAKAPLP